MRRWLLVLAFLLAPSLALAQGCGPQNPNCIVPTAPVGTSNNQAASTAFVQANGGTILNSLAPFTFLCNPTGITAAAIACPALTAVAPLGISGSALNVNTSTTNGIFVGGAGPAGTITTNSVGIGFLALSTLSTGNGNFALGLNALGSITTGANNVGIGVNAGFGLSGAASSNVAIGPGILGTSSTGVNNTAIGVNCLNKATGSNNTCIGELALSDLTSGSGNTAVGPSAGRGLTTGSNNTVLGACLGLTGALASAIAICDGVTNVRIDWGVTTASTLTLAAPVAIPGTVGANAFKSTGTVPTGNTGTCSTGVTVSGGATAGTWTSTAACALTTGTIILTAMPTQTTGYTCFVSDRTTAGVVVEQTATTATSATFVVRALPTGTVQVSANDILQYSCMGY
jgi:hypothetical protein